MKKILDTGVSNVDKDFVLPSSWLFGEGSLLTKIALLLNLHGCCYSNLHKNGNWLLTNHSQSVILTTVTKDQHFPVLAVSVGADSWEN